MFVEGQVASWQDLAYLAYMTVEQRKAVKYCMQRLLAEGVVPKTEWAYLQSKWFYEDWGSEDGFVLWIICST